MAEAWQWARQTFKNIHNTQYVQIKRGRHFCGKVGNTGWSRGWWIVHLDQVGKALTAAASGTFAVLGSLVVELLGMSIGGAMSSAAVSVRFGAEEHKAFSSEWAVKNKLKDQLPPLLDWMRYVDDVMSLSRCVCSNCMEAFFKHTYSEPVSTVYSSACANKKFYMVEF